MAEAQDKGRIGLLAGKRILLIIGGGIAAYKALELIRRLRERGASVRCVMTKAAHEFVTPLSVASLSGEPVNEELFSLTDEAEMGHIQLSRAADLLVVAPATANLLARMAGGLADDLATTLLLATDKPVLAAPAMNVRMWLHPATTANVALLRQRGVLFVGPEDGDMACGEYGPGRLSEPMDILHAVEDFFAVTPAPGVLAGRRVLVTSGPTHEPIDPVRYLANRSSGKQGHAIAAALQAAGAEVTLVTGPVTLPDPVGVTVLRVETAQQMADACRRVAAEGGARDAAICAAAVADWHVVPADEKLKKDGSGTPPALRLQENPDILSGLSAPGPGRPALVVGFAAETEKVAEHGRAKRLRKGCDWLLANDVSTGSGTFGGEENAVLLIAADGEEAWPRMSKVALATRLARRIADHFTGEASAAE
ncbi:bifunctional phosphopantothenoylcysteine decarboxylase/phosphopantothenate--cysteine ligase CoaBC [Radicibacter daui]|uniref:bifunctional phosphopantothenoylcysteine decarboxylase/phosphopantothenate--cysteine ligase CoaBC n=1 Tax=Radicibacter daui TaxID=3064829 RepID=UPI0040469FA2